MKNLSITKKLLLLSTPAIAALIILSLIFISLMDSVSKSTRQALYDELYVPSAAMLNADRDFYQAYVAEDGIALIKARQSEAEQAKAFEGLIVGFLNKAKQELTYLGTQEPAPRPSEQLEVLVADFSQSAQKELDTLNAQGVALRPSKVLETLVADFSKNVEQEISLLQSQTAAARPSAALENLVADFAKNAQGKLNQLTNQEAVSDESKQMESLAADFSENSTQVKARMDDAFAKIQANRNLFENFAHPTANVTLKQLYQVFTAGFEEWLRTNLVTNDSADMQKHQAAFNTAREQINLMTELLDAYALSRTSAIQSQISNSTASSIAIVLSVAILLTVLAFFVIHYLKKNILYINGISKRIAEGELQFSMDDRTFAKDEIGQLSKSMSRILYRLGEYHNYLLEITSVLDAMKQGEMAVRLDQAYEGEFAAVKTALLGISSSLSETLYHINTAAVQVSTGASQVAGGAQALAAGSTEQASAIEELNASLARIAAQASENSASVKMVTEHAEQASGFVRNGSEHMAKLNEAMANIGTASNQIANITKVIEDIAFQTNILALNAAIEAARAGNAGKGFAVVADEVRNLAAKSAEAARKTADLIGQSTRTVSDGIQIAAKTAQILKSVEEKETLVSESIIHIDKSSMDQAAAIEQIKQGLAQVSSVVQTNAATAEENSATSEQMSAQAGALRDEVSKFRLNEGY